MLAIQFDSMIYLKHDCGVIVMNKDKEQIDVIGAKK